jgi:hypothetical protein
MRALLDARVALTSELSLDALLQRLVGTAAELTDARYAAMGVIDPSGTELERLVTTGLIRRRTQRSATSRAVAEFSECSSASQRYCGCMI